MPRPSRERRSWTAQLPDATRPKKPPLEYVAKNVSNLATAPTITFNDGVWTEIQVHRRQGGRPRSSWQTSVSETTTWLREGQGPDCGATAAGSWRRAAGRRPCHVPLVHRWRPLLGSHSEGVGGGKRESACQLWLPRSGWHRRWAARHLRGIRGGSEPQSRPATMSTMVARLRAQLPPRPTRTRHARTTCLTVELSGARRRRRAPGPVQPLNGAGNGAHPAYPEAQPPPSSSFRSSPVLRRRLRCTCPLAGRRRRTRGAAHVCLLPGRPTHCPGGNGGAPPASPGAVAISALAATRPVLDHRPIPQIWAAPVSTRYDLPTGEYDPDLALLKIVQLID